MMRTGQPTFYPARLTEAREAREGRTLISLARAMNLNTSSVSRWEDGQSIPSAERLVQLAEELKVRPTYFLRPPFPHGDTPFFTRSLATARKRDIVQQRARLRWVQDVSQVVQHYVQLPPLALPDVLGGQHYSSLRNDDFERAADDLRRHWKLGSAPIVNVVETMERMGFVVACDEIGSTALDGLCNWSAADGRPYILLANDKMSFFRRQMDAAHEMSHAIAHRNVTHEELYRDFHLIERQAFRLASAVLMPASSFSLAVGYPTISTLLNLKDQWRVSVKAMIRRCRELRLTDEEGEAQLYKYYSAKGWNREEPLDRLVPVTQPRLLGQAIGMIVDAGLRTKEQLLSADFTIPARDIEELIALPEGWFGRETGRVIQLRLQSSPAPFGGSPTGGAEVVAFSPNKKAERQPA